MELFFEKDGERLLTGAKQFKFNSSAQFFSLAENPYLYKTTSTAYQRCFRYKRSRAFYTVVSFFQKIKSSCFFKRLLSNSL